MRRIYSLSATLTMLAVFMSWTMISSAKTDSFWMKAAESGMAEVALGNLALQRSQNESVKSFARQMVDDHTTANNELMSMAQGKSIVLPTTMDKMHQAAMDKMSGLSGADFDHQFMMQMVKDHKAAVALFEKTSASSKDSDAKAFAAKHLPTLRSHLEMAMSMSTSNGMNNSGMSDGGGDMEGSGNSNRRSNSNSNRMMNSNSDTMNSNSDMMNSNAMNSNSNRGRSSNSNRMMNSNSNGMMNSNSSDNSNGNSNSNSNRRSGNSNSGNRSTNSNSSNSNGNGNR
jgi:predicted outer membrane protein